MNNNIPLQNTLKGKSTFSGIALHTGVRAHLTINPAEKNTGIIFRRIDIPGKPSVKAIASNVVDVRRGTTIANKEGATVLTVEHVLAALSACNIDNALIDMDGPEPPIADGSAEPFLKMILEVGIEQQTAPAIYWTPSSSIIKEEGETITIINPHPSTKKLPESNEKKIEEATQFMGLKISSLVQYGDFGIGTQYYSNEITKDEFINNLAPARTLVEYRDLKQLIAMGLVKGGSLDNAVIIHDGAIICKDDLRFDDELVRHKVTDIIGDMALIGCRLNAHIITIKPGHASNVVIAQEILQLMAKK
jgi:UDP-3-O-[3-hydroxymyristoyl] N-acetylglucosamine deacetylase